MMRRKTSNHLEQACKDAFSNMKRRRKETEDQELESVIENLFCNQNNDDRGIQEFDDLDVEMEGKMMLRKRKGSTLIDILDRPVKRKKRRRKKPRKKSDSALIDDNSTVASISKLDFSKYSNLGTGKQKPRITSHSFKSRIYSQKWSKGETKLFFRALGLFGTDFSMMTMMFKGRTRSQIINKFHKEEKENPQKIEKALNSHKNCESKLLTRYTHFLESAKKESLSKEGNNRVRLNSSSSLDSTDQTMYEELFKCIKQGLQHLQSRSCAQDRSSIRSSIRSSSRLQETPSFSNSKAPSMSGDSTMSSSRLHE